ncbi:hypothetical protein KAU93_02430, partial [Candidatus Bathyarchaeota archaeon]|nr:hypothetical protein [Candidatus Bathyarchaeota archaeon]
RTAEILVSATGEFITAPFYGHFQSFFDPHSPKIKQYQVIQETPRKILIKIIPDEGYSPEDTETIRRIMRSVMGNLEIEIKLVDSIATSGSGKRQVRVRKFPIDFTRTG